MVCTGALMPVATAPLLAAEVLVVDAIIPRDNMLNGSGASKDDLKGLRAAIGR